jgi:DNA-binding NarL/FixJ family response regulator
MNQLRILVADDHEIVRRGICEMLRAHSGWQVCGEAADGRSAVEQVMQLKPDIVILDIGMPNLNGLDAARKILHYNPRQRVLILTVTDTEQVVLEVLHAGAKAYLSKSDAAKDLVRAVESLEHNRSYFNSRAGQIVLGGFLDRGPRLDKTSPQPILTPREREILQLIAEGKSTKEVAVTLNLSVKTAETHRSNMMRKLDLHSVSALVLYAIRNNIVQIPASYAGGACASSVAADDTRVSAINS